MGLGSGEPCHPAQDRWAGSRCSSYPRTRGRAAAVSRWRSLRTRSRPSGSRSIPDAADTRGMYEGTVSVIGRGRGACAPRRASDPRLRPARRQQPRRHGLLRARPARALPGPQPGSRLPPICAPPSRGAGPRLRRGEGEGTSGPLQRRRLHTPQGYEGPGQGVGNRIVPRSFYGPGPRVPREGDGLARGRCVDELREHDTSRRADVPLPARRALSRRSTRGEGLRGAGPLEPGAGRQAPALPDQDGSSRSSRGSSTSGAFRRRPST